MSRASAISVAIAAAGASALASAGFARPAAAATATFAALFTCGARRAALVVAVLVAIGLIVAMTPVDATSQVVRR